MWPLEYYFQLPIWLNLPIGQFFGAIIFWYIDNLILNPDFNFESVKVSYYEYLFKLRRLSRICK